MTTDANGNVLEHHLIKLNILNLRRGRRKSGTKIGYDERVFFKNLVEQVMHQIVVFMRKFEEPVA